MRWHKIFLLLYLTAAGNFSTVTAQQITGNKKGMQATTYAIIIGITNYQSPAIPGLLYADNDAVQFYAWLQSKAGGEVPVNNIKLLLNKEATIAAIYDALDWLKEKCSENDKAYIYFSGHGDVETKNNYSKGYLLAYNSPQNNYANNAIRIEDINNTSISLTTKNKTKVIIISDACHSGKLAGDFYKGKQLAASQLNQVLNDQVRLASCQENELAAEGPDWGGGRGVFSYYLIMGLQGLAKSQEDGSIQLNDLTNYLDSTFAADKTLLKNKYQQHPVSDGNPYFKMAITDQASVAAFKTSLNKNNSDKAELPEGLMALKPLQLQPIDYFFSTVKPLALESFVNFRDYETLSATDLALKIVGDCITYQTNLYQKRDSDKNGEAPYMAYEVFNLDSLNLLYTELIQNKSLTNRFISNFIQMVHEKGQDMINAYLKGDLDELEKRQYYYSGKRDYRNYIPMLQVAMKHVSPDHYLSPILEVHFFYLSGVIDRLQMATNTNTDSLLKAAFFNVQQALKREPYAAYIVNEFGNLYLHQKNYDSANYYFNLASTISPTWAIPWSNQIKMNLEFGKLGKAEQAIKTADSLQPNLAFVLINAGLVMEKKKNILAAESYYLRAIKENNVHYLPYERLANIYLNTNRYDKANYYFYAAQTRKEDFVVNDKNFEYGIELGAIQWNPINEPVIAECLEELPQNTASAVYLNLFHLLNKSDSSVKEEELIKSLQKIITQKPDIPLAYHYLGKLYYANENWQLALQFLEKSLLHHYSDEDLLKKIKNDIMGNKVSADDSCKLMPFLNLQFDVLEDHYMVAAIFEKNTDYNNALTQYKLIATIENNRQLEQAVYKNYVRLVKNFRGILPDLNNYLTKAFESPIIMFGAIKAARLQEKLGQYAEAEKILLQQISLNREAGYERQRAIREKRPGWNVNGAGGLNYYWLTINSYLESETYNFYHRMLKLFPRDAAWQKKTGQFLYERLLLAFRQVPVEQYQSFYQSISNYAYPWKGAVEQNEDYNFIIPGTEESLMIASTTFDPVKEAIDAINLAVKYSGEVKPAKDNAIALANLYSWINDIEQSDHWFRQALDLQPDNAKLRSQFVAYLSSSDLLPEACKQLQILNTQKKNTQDQRIQLTDWLLLAGQNEQAANLLQQINPVDKEEKRNLMILKARTNLLQGNAKNALNYWLDSIQEIELIKNYSDDDLKVKKELQNKIRLYSIARLYAVLNKKELAFEMLKQSLDAGFNFEYVLYYDTAWEKINNSEKWNKLVNESGYKYELEIPNTEINPIGYRTPNRENLK